MSRLDTDESRWVRPTKYNLDYWSVDLNACTFEGQVRVEVQRESGRKTCDTVKLHAKTLEVKKAWLECKGGETVHAKDIEMISEEEIVAMRFDASEEWLEMVEQVVVEFSGKLDDSLAGLYRSHYTNEAGEKRCIAVTQFEATDARRAFPCFDEPNLKATMSLSVTTHMDRTCLSNMPVVFTKTDFVKKTKFWKFDETPIMSTYLYALVIGDFDVVTGYSNRGVLTSVYTRPGCADQGQFALRVACGALDYYEREYGIEYPLKKQDLASLPDFAAGAMENWGLVTYREQRLMVNENSSAAAKLSVARVVAHENAHMWFGNLVTMQYWTDLWLNEGFARFMEFNCVNHLFPEWRTWTVFVQDIQSLALRLDSMSSTHPVRVEVKTPDQISEIFDAISYAKGASIIRMLESYLGHDRFMQGVQHYLKTFAYQNAVTDDLWRCIEEANVQHIQPGSVRELMAAWTGKMGYPVIIVEDEAEGKLKVSIEQFMYNTANAKDRLVAKEAGAAWQIPLKIISSTSPTVERLTVTGPAEIETVKAKMESSLRESGWLTLNAEMTGFFRVCYSPKQWKLLGRMMADRPDGSSSIPSPDPQSIGLSCNDRLGLIRDAFCCATSGYLSMSVPLELTRMLLCKNGIVEKDAAVLLELVSWISSLAELYRDEPFFNQYAEKILLPCCAPILEELSWEARSPEKEDFHSVTLRPNVLKALAKVPAELAGDKYQLVSVALKKVQDHCNGIKSLEPDQRLAILQLAAKDNENASSLFATLHERHLREDIPAEERRDMLSTLAGMASHDSLLDPIVHFALNDVRIQDFALVSSRISNASQKAGQVMWDRFTTDFATFWEKYHSVSFIWGSVVEGIVGALRTEDHMNAVRAFFENKEKGSAARSLDRGLERIQSRLDRLDRERSNVAAYLASI